MQESSFALSSLRSGAARATGGAAFRRDQPKSVVFWRALLINSFALDGCGMI